MIGRGRNLSVERDVLTLHVRATDPSRLDVYIIESLVWKSRNRVQELIRRGRIMVNGAAAKPSRRVRQGDTIELYLSGGAPPATHRAADLEVMYEDAWMLALNKPPGLLVHPVGRHVYNTLINLLHERYHPESEPSVRTPSARRREDAVPRLCHRLDKETTGVVVVARDAYVHREIMAQFENRLVRKEYIALVDGYVQAEELAIRVPIGEGRCLRSSLEHPQLKDAETRIRVLRRFDRLTLVKCLPLTGRQNQIRIHLATIGNPIIGDTRFGGREPPAGFPRRYLLHAASVRLFHPRLKLMLEIEAELPADFLGLVGRGA